MKANCRASRVHLSGALRSAVAAGRRGTTADLTELICVGSEDESGRHELSRTPECRNIRVFPYWRLLAGRAVGLLLGHGDRDRGKAPALRAHCRPVGPGQREAGPGQPHTWLANAGGGGGVSSCRMEEKRGHQTGTA